MKEFIKIFLKNLKPDLDFLLPIIYGVISAVVMSPGIALAFNLFGGLHGYGALAAYMTFVIELYIVIQFARSVEEYNRKKRK